MSWSLRFLGVGNAQAAGELGSASGVIEHDGRPVLMIDCGAEALAAYLAHYGAHPSAVYITHVHMDHVAGLERLFFATYFDPARRGKLRLYVHANVVPHLQQRLADYPGVIAEGGANWWDAFQLVPVSRGFWHEGRWYDVFPCRHHLPETAYGLRLAGSVLWSGDTRPIPDVMARYAGAGELVAHDCALHGNPSHTGADDVEREYPVALRAQMMLYHYESVAARAALRDRGYHVAEPGEVVPLPEPTGPVLAS